jgi:opacity protein-like surface antigen
MEPSPLDLGIWRGGIGNGFRDGTIRAGFTLGGGFGVRLIPRYRAHDLAMASTGLGWVFTEPVARDTWWQGNWELTGDLFGGGQFEPSTRHFLGASGGIRYDFATGTLCVPVLGGAVGISETDIGRPDLSTRFEFNVQPGFGVHCFLTESMALTVEYRWLHFSNAGIKQPNQGTNTQMFLLGLAWFL